MEFEFPTLSDLSINPDEFFKKPEVSSVPEYLLRDNSINKILDNSNGFSLLGNQIKQSLSDLFKTQNNIADFNLQQQQKWGDIFAGAKLGLGLLSGLSTLGNMWLGFQNYKLAKQQLGIAKEQWAKTKEELARINKVRNKLTQSYMGE